MSRPNRHGHGMRGRKTKTYVKWCSMRNRCRANSPEAARYFARGITVCERWDRYEDFLADMGEVPLGLTIERIDNDGNYEPGNCKWATPAVQARNRRNTTLTIGAVRVIRRCLQFKMQGKDIAPLFGVSFGQISKIKLGQKWVAA